VKIVNATASAGKTLMSHESQRLFSHMIYELKKGVRRLSLYTCPESETEFCTAKLEKSGITYMVSPASSGKSNVFFGECACVRILESFGDKKLNEFDEKEDFILGAMLGYDLTKQCERYLEVTSPKRCQSCKPANQANCL